MARIYVIDDDAQLLRMVGLMLQRGGHTTQLITNPVEGLEAVRNDRPDLLVLDVMMPDMNGHDLTRQIRETKGLEDLPILILTARSQEVDRVTALGSGADDYLSKPVAAQELIERVDRLLTQKRIRQSDQRSAQRPLPNGLVIAFYGLRGGVGRTTLAVNLAVTLRRLSQQEVCLVDFSPSGGQCLLHLRQQSKSSWGELTAVGLITTDQLAGQMNLHPSGLRILPAPNLPLSPVEPASETAAQILELLPQNMAFTVVDLPASLNPALLATLNVADMAFHVVGRDVVGVQTAVYLNQALEQAHIIPKHKAYILNHPTPDTTLPQAAVERALNGRIALQVEYDANQGRALTQGVPLALTKDSSPILIFINRLAEAIYQRAGSE